METHFDDISRELAHGLSRRKTLVMLGSSFLGGLLGALGLGKTTQASVGCVVDCSTCSDATAKECRINTTKKIATCRTISPTLLCNQAHQEAAYGKLKQHLMAEGYFQTQGSEGLVLRMNGKLYSSALLTRYAHSIDPEKTAFLQYKADGTASAAVANVFLNGTPIYIIFVDSNGQVKRNIPENGVVPSLTSSNSHQIAAFTEKDCNFWCSLGATIFTGTTCTLVGNAICPLSGPGILACALVVGNVCGIASWGAGFACGPFCKPEPCPPQGPTPQKACGSLCCSENFSCCSTPQGSPFCVFPGPCPTS